MKNPSVPVFVTVDNSEAPQQCRDGHWYCRCGTRLDEHKHHYGIQCDHLFLCTDCKVNWILDTAGNGMRVWRRIEE